MNIGDRMKLYEKTFHFNTIHRMPVMIRVDGRAFHSFTRGMDKPFDKRLINSMIYSAVNTSKDMQGFKVAYIQSDEVTFCLTDYDDLDTQGWFDYDLAKIVSISASLMTAFFINALFNKDNINIHKPPVFDSRAFTIPKEEVVNCFLWRAQDWKRNSLEMYARHFFSHKQLLNKNQADIHEMLHGIGNNWTTDLSEVERNGTFIIGSELRTDILPTNVLLHYL